MRLLHVEDNALDADLVRRALTAAAEGVQIDLATTLAEARARLAAGAAYDALLTDLHLPDGHGIDLIREVRAAGLPLAVVAMTGQGDETVVLAALKAGADDYLAKRDELSQQIGSTLRAALARFRADAERHARALRVLYAEHDAMDLDLTRQHFARHATNLSLHGVHDSAGVLAVLPRGADAASTCDVLLLDYRLTGDSGLDVLKAVREERDLDLPVVMVTGQGGEDVAAQAMRLGATDYVVKRDNYLLALPAVIENAFHRVNAAREHAALRHSEERLALMLRGSSDAPWDMDLAGGGRYVSPRLWSMLGHDTPPEHVEDVTLGSLLNPQQRAAVMQRLAAALEGRDEAIEAELGLRHRDGHHVPMLARGFISRDASGRALRVSGTLTDLTERRRAEAEIRELNATLERRVASRTQELEEANRELEAFTYSVSHDLRAPLRAVDALAALLEREHGDMLGEDGARKLRLLRQSTASMERLIHDLLEFARTSRQTPRRTTVPTTALVQHCVEAFRAEIDARGVRVQVDALPDCAADPNLLRQVFLNLIGNAVKYTRKQAQPQVWVSAQLEGDTTAYCVRDNGSGFSMDQAGKLFKVFQRLHHDAEFEGTGVGLAIVERIVRRHGGRVWAEAAPGQGATFCFVLGPAETAA